MTTEQKLERLCTAGEKMRKLQNVYFSERKKGRTADRERQEAQAAEQQFDAILREVRQRSMFST